jgi:hypothetical protein
MSLHAFDENCENLIFFEFLVSSQGVNLGFVTSNVHVAKSSFLSFDFLDGSKVDGLSGVFHGVDQNHSMKLLKQVFFPMAFQNFEWFPFMIPPSLFPHKKQNLFPHLFRTLPTQNICVGFRLNVC